MPGLLQNTGSFLREEVPAKGTLMQNKHRLFMLQMTKKHEDWQKSGACFPALPLLETHRKRRIQKPATCSISILYYTRKLRII